MCEHFSRKIWGEETIWEAAIGVGISFKKQNVSVWTGFVW